MAAVKKRRTIQDASYFSSSHCTTHLPASGFGVSFFLPKRPKKGILRFVTRVRKKRETLLFFSSFEFFDPTIEKKKSDEEQELRSSSPSGKEGSESGELPPDEPRLQALPGRPRVAPRRRQRVPRRTQAGPGERTRIGLEKKKERETKKEKGGQRSSLDC